MAETQKDKIARQAIEVLANYPTGISYSDLARKIKDGLPETLMGTVHGNLVNLDKTCPEISKPERGLWILTKYLSSADLTKKQTRADSKVSDPHKFPSESSFYSSFAEYLVQDLDECTKAIPSVAIDLVIGGERRMFSE